MNTRINQLLDYALKNSMITEDDVSYSANLLLDLLKIDTFERVETEEASIYDILDDLLSYCVEKGLIDDNTTEKDLFDTRIMNCVMPRPKEVIQTFKELYEKDPKEATDYFYNLSINSNYIRKSRTDKNVKFNHEYKYGDIQITINLSKPEKDPKEIAKAKLVKSSGYPKCLLCKENVGYAGHMNHPARQTHRIIPMNLNGRSYFLQYSPYVYYNEHCILFNSEHIPMVINRNSFENLVGFTELFPHYMAGSNADLPIVGGSILTHDHYQGGKHHFPMEDATTLDEREINGVNVKMLNWPLSTLRLTSDNKEAVIDLAEEILNKWIDYSDESVDIISHTDGVRHNTVTPIARRQGDAFQLDVVLRNNRTSDEHPLGIFHPHAQHHHIKKENIGLIEVMGLAVLPARLKDELELIKKCLINELNFDEIPALEKHKEWFEYLKKYDVDASNVDEFIEMEVTKKFVFVLEDAGVYKINEAGIEAFKRFVDTLGE